MLFRLSQHLLTAIAVFYAVEGVGLIEKGKYFPTLPRLEATASDPRAWLGAAEWGLTNLGQQISAATHQQAPALPQMASLQSAASQFSQRLTQERQAAWAGSYRSYY